MELNIQQPVFLIEVDKIKPNSYQPRRSFDEAALKELAGSIREYGVLQPLMVTKIETETESGTAIEYELIAGERRLLASKMVGLERVPAIIRQVATQKERLELAMIENIQRADLNPVELAKAYSRLQEEFGLTQREIAVRLGKSREAIANTIRLLDLPSDILESLVQNKINESQGRLLLSVAEPMAQQNLFNDLLRNNLSVRELKNKIQDFKLRQRAQVEAATIKLPDPEIEAIKQRLEEKLGTKIHLEKSGGTGRITIAFYSNEELQTLVAKLTQLESGAADLDNDKADQPQDSNPDLSF